MPNFATALTGESGENGVAKLVMERLGWCARRQGNPDVGIDMQIEVGAGDGDATARLLGVQVKSGPSAFKEPAADGSGWVFRMDLEHLDYWLNYPLPVILVLYDIDREVGYWQHITSQTVSDTGKGFKILVPNNQRIDADSADALAALAERAGANGLQEFLLQLPPSCAALLSALDREAPSLARRLARALVNGRTTPARTVQDLAAQAPETWPHTAWLILGQYAVEYEDRIGAIDCFIRIDATAEPEQRGRWTAFAGSMLSPTDPDRARELLTEASATPGGRLLGPIGLAILDHGLNVAPVPLPDIVLASADETERDPAIQRFLADQAQRAGDLNLSLEHHEKALRLAPDNTNQQLALAEILLRRPEGTPAARLMSDYRRAANLASSVRAGKRRWLGDSVPAAYLLQSALLLAEDVDRAFRVSRAQPDGEATDAEAASPKLAMHVARVAYEQGRPERAEPFAAIVEASDDHEARTMLAAVRARAEGSEGQESRWRDALAATADTGTQLMILGELADLGCWPLGELERLRDDQQLRPGMYDLIHARALTARGETRQAQVLLRRHLATNALAAERYVALLAADDKIDDAIAVCDAASSQFGGSRHDLQALDVLAGAEGRTEQLLTRAAGFLSRSGQPYSLRHHVRSRLLALHEQRRDWAAAERLSRDGLEEVIALLDDLHDGKVDQLSLPETASDDLQELKRGYVLMLITQQFNRGHTARALATFEEFAPEIREAFEAEIWLDLHRLHGWTQQDIVRAFELAEHGAFPEMLVGRILFTLVQTCEPDSTVTHAGSAESESPGAGTSSDDLDRIAIPPSLHEKITEAWNAHFQRRAAAEAPGQGSGMLSEQELTNRALPDYARQTLADAAIWEGKLPVGAASIVAGTPYLLAVAERRARILPIADPDPDIYRGELSAADASLGEPVSIETTALFVSAALLDQWVNIHPEFGSVLLAERAAHDIFMSHLTARALGGNVDYYRTDLSTLRSIPANTPAETLRRMRRHVTAVHSATQDCTVTHQLDLSALGAKAPRDINGPWPWLAPIALAVERGIALYSDDASIRAQARTYGVPAFGSLALLETLGTQRDVLPDRGMALALLFAHHAVDLPDVAGLIRNALNAGDATSGPVLINLARPTYWQVHTRDFAATVAGIVTPAYWRDPSSLAPLTSAIATGAAAAFADTASATALTAAVILTQCTTVTREAADIVVPIIRAIAAQHSADPIITLREMLVNALTDPVAPVRRSRTTAVQIVDHALRLHETGTE
ncbi:DUF4365 domain-containing protein [Actinospica sp. MGRD01-02]|uniref:DUF4365 domain-containing protein n=1 Tax=Actinospica acidithermotolerans TaxID=2828514 RepID=A0A941EJU3_9ACTN|nr:DUF4365 domain-containing protein [Actinospica acidithermotolerans]MBR7830409.1 DUF4365 domain-containing protein [Actinospica acidithermotolerans]